ncbi:MAG: 1-phosphofructokinase [Armatimonadetes bacterium]|nr:1-phosphofructokinase [Armatimonadota bacterium]
MVLTVTPNAAIDKTYTIEDFSLDRVHRPSAARTVAGGKGINVVRVLKELGRKGIATGFAGGATGEAIIQALDEEWLRHDFVRVAGESRLCIAVVDPKNGTQTEVNENGPEITEAEVSLMLEKAAALVGGMDYVVLCGSCPPGVPTSFYGGIIEIAKKVGVKSVLDTSGDHIREAIKSGPYMIKPNIAELSQLAGRELLTIEEIVRAAKSLKQYGVSITSVTMGRSGAMVTDGVQAWMAVPPEIRFASAVGSGDSFVAAFLDSLMNGESLPLALIAGTAAGAANATTFGAGFCKKESIMELKQGVTLTKLD